MGKNVTLKGTNEGYLLLLDDDSSLKSIYEELEELLNNIKTEDKLEKDFNLIIDTGNRLFTENAKNKITKIIQEQSNFIIKEFVENVVEIELADQWYQETAPKMVVRNIRNGQIVESKRDIVLFGDVRPGGVVRSSGNIIIIGNVQGLVHAGAEGSEESVIIAPFSFDGQVRISEHIEVIDTLEKDSDQDNLLNHQIVFLNDLHTIEFETVDKLAQIRPHFAKELGGFKEWQKRL